VHVLFGNGVAVLDWKSMRSIGPDLPFPERATVSFFVVILENRQKVMKTSMEIKLRSSIDIYIFN
jgi:hypothetical protein